MLTCYAPVCRSSIAAVARLACLNHAASVHSEPGSNSPKILPKQAFEGPDPGIRTIFLKFLVNTGDIENRVFFWEPAIHIAGFTRCKVDFTVDRIVAQKNELSKNRKGPSVKEGRADGEGD